MNRDRLQDVVAIDVHTHATVSTRNPHDEVVAAIDAATATYFKEAMPRLQSAARRDCC